MTNQTFTNMELNTKKLTNLTISMQTGPAKENR